MKWSLIQDREGSTQKSRNSILSLIIKANRNYLKWNVVINIVSLCGNKLKLIQHIFFSLCICVSCLCNFFPKNLFVFVWKARCRGEDNPSTSSCFLLRIYFQISSRWVFVIAYRSREDDVITTREERKRGWTNRCTVL
jgi:hypothetical protein